jgi:ferrous iron transport protein B
MALVFQALFAWASLPADWIDALFGTAGGAIQFALGEGWLSGLLVDGILAGIGGVAVFIPQIFLLFLLLGVLEEVGYMSRAVYMFDNVLQRFGLNGRSIVALVSGGACAIPAIMSTRTISNWKERLTTIMVTPLISCSARIPVYIVLVGFVVPADQKWGFFNLQGLVFFGLYVLSIISALVSAWVFKKVLKTGEKSMLMIELPLYKKPIWKNVMINLREKLWAFVWEAGKVIFFISIILWFLASYGPKEQMKQAEVETEIYALTNNFTPEQTQDLLAARKIEASYAGHMGKFIEPVIKPLGFDWKIGIALITSFAAREVFVGTMATIYAIGSSDDEGTIRERMGKEINQETGEKVYTPAVAMSLLVFYLFAMQCMSTLAITKRETNTWKWPIIQFVYMTALAYLGSLFVFQVFG